MLVCAALTVLAASAETPWGMFATVAVVALGAGGAVTAWIQGRNARAALVLERAAKTEERQATRDDGEIDRLWKQLNLLQEEIGELKAEVKKLQAEKQGVTRIARYWYEVATKAITALGPEKAKELGLPAINQKK
jgi:uncharacterized protein HemX